MAILTKKFNIQKSGSSAVACNIYSTTTETGDNYFPCIVGGVEGVYYVALGTISDSNATVGRVKSVAKYFKYIDVSWTQPVLTSNGTMGGDSFACDQSNYYSSADEPAQYAHYVFDGEYIAGKHEWQANSVSTSSWYWLSWYNPQPIKISQIIVSNAQPNYVVKAWKLQGCDDNSSWVDLATGTNTNTADGGKWTISVAEENQKLYKYHRIYCQPNDATAIMIGALAITATTQSLIEVSSNESYDYVDESLYAIKSQAKPPYTKITYTTAGVYTFTVPSGITQVKLTIAGGGGGGAGTDSYGYKGTCTGYSKSSGGYYSETRYKTGYRAGGAGGAGGLYTGTVTVTTGSTYTITVGAGGVGGSGNDVNGEAGGTSSFDSLASATGGGGGNQNVAGSAGSPTGAGGAGGAGGASTSGSSGSDGGTGWVYVEYGGDI